MNIGSLSIGFDPHPEGWCLTFFRPVGAWALVYRWVLCLGPVEIRRRTPWRELE